MKPSWNDAPDWAQWLAKDADEMWYWHESKPEINRSYGEWNSHGFVEMHEDGIDWRDSREARPK